jgi:hypothetical protein
VVDDADGDSFRSSARRPPFHHVAASRGWRLLRFEGPLPLDQTGILASVTGPLAGAHVSLLAVATYDTDYVLVPAAQRHAAIAALETAGHSISAGV